MSLSVICFIATKRGSGQLSWLFKIVKAVGNRFALFINNSNSVIITLWNDLNRKAAMYKHSWRLIYCSESPIQYPLVGSVNARRIITMNVNDSLKCGWPLRQRLRRVDYGVEGHFIWAPTTRTHTHTHPPSIPSRTRYLLRNWAQL